MRNSQRATAPAPAPAPALPQEETAPGPRFIQAKEVERLYGLSARTLANYRVQKIGPRYSKCGRRVVYSIADLDAYMEAHAYGTSDQPKGD